MKVLVGSNKQRWVFAAIVATPLFVGAGGDWSAGTWLCCLSIPALLIYTFMKTIDEGTKQAQVVEMMKRAHKAGKEIVWGV